MTAVADLTDEQTAGVTQLMHALDDLTSALLVCRTSGLNPADAFRACGIPVPTFAGAALNQLLDKTERVPDEPTAIEA